MTLYFIVVLITLYISADPRNSRRRAQFSAGGILAGNSARPPTRARPPRRPRYRFEAIAKAEAMEAPIEPKTGSERRRRTASSCTASSW